MLVRKQIEAYAEKAGRIAYTVLGLDSPYSIAFIDDPTISEDARLDTQKNEVQINLALLEPFSTETMPGPSDMTEKQEKVYENYRHMMKVYYLVYHEMRHLYQKRAVEAYQINKMLGGGHIIPPLESDKKCALWLSEMTTPGSEQDIEEDANDFAYYLTNRFPANLPMARTSRRLAAIKRKYDKVEITEDGAVDDTADEAVDKQ